ncbi:MAG: RimK/LysX family protein [Spirochaetales bacterium]|nr:RimK/LysX family protein [Spirochaetales bacterium]
MKKDLPEPTAIGWREWISFPDWGIEYTKVKVDTGARSSSLHVGDLEYFQEKDEEWVSFFVYPWQESTKDKVRIKAKVLDYKQVKSSSGCKDRRPVISADLVVAGRRISTELTLSNRSEMGFRMLLGRASIRKGFIIYPGRSYLGGKAPADIRKRNRGNI